MNATHNQIESEETSSGIFYNGERIGTAITKEVADKLSSLYQAALDNTSNEKSGGYKAEGIGDLINVDNLDEEFPIPYHCLLRILTALSYCDVVTSGSALERDCFQIQQIVSDHVRRLTPTEKGSV